MFRIPADRSNSARDSLSGQPSGWPVSFHAPTSHAETRSIALAGGLATSSIFFHTPPKPCDYCDVVTLVAR